MRIQHHRLALLLITTALVGFGCSDEVSQDELEDPGFFARESLGGPPGSAYQYRGMIDGKVVFVGEVRDFVPGRHMPAHSYSSEEGWSTSTFPETAWRVTDADERIVAAGDAHFFLEHISGDKHAVLFRTTDGGESWEEVDVEPAYAFDLRGGGGALYLYEERFDNPEDGYVRNLWRSTDAGESWEVVRDDLAAPGYTAVGDAIVVQVATEQGRVLAISRDRGETWQYLEPGSPFVQLPPLSDWQRHDEMLLTTAQRNPLPQVLGWSDESGLSVYPVQGTEDGITWVAVAGESVYASTSGGQVGKLTGTPSDWANEPPSWEPILLPEDATLVTQSGMNNPARNIFGFADGSVAAHTESGLLQLEQGDEVWKPAWHFNATADYAIEVGDDLISGQSGQFFRRHDEAWTPVELPTELTGEARDALLTRLNDAVYAIPTTPDRSPSVFRVDLDTNTLEQVWQDDQAGRSYHGMTRQPSAHLLTVDGQTIVGSAGAFREVITASGDTLLDSSGGGVFTLDLDSGTTEPLFDTSDNEQYLSVQQMVHHDGAIWVLSATQGVWKVALDGSGMTEMHEGLPAELATPIHELVRGLHSTGDSLYAFSTTSIWVLDGGTWSKIDTGELAEATTLTGLDPLGSQVNTNAIMALDHLDNRLIVATLEGIYLLDPTTGEFVDGRSDFDRPIYKLLRTESGLYVSLWQGGLHRLTER